MKRRSKILSKRQWLAQVKPLMEAPPTPPQVTDTGIVMEHLSKPFRLLAHEYGVAAVVTALGLRLEDPAAAEEWLKANRAEKMIRMMAKEPMR